MADDDSGVPDTQRLRSMRWQNLVLLGAALLLALALAAGIAWQDGLLSRLRQVYFLADDVTAVSPGTTVRLSGFRIGKVASMQLQPDLKVKVVLNIDAGAFASLHSDARAELVREQLKPAAIDLRAGSAAQPLAADDPRVAFGRRVTLTDAAEDLRARLAPILDDVKQITGRLNERKADLEAVIVNSRQLTQDLAATARELHALSSGLRERVGTLGVQSAATLAEAKGSLLRVGAVVGQAEQTLNSLNGRLPALMQRADNVLANLETVSRDVRVVTGAAAADLPPLLSNLPPLIDDSREIVQGVRQAWPVRGLLAPPTPALQPIDSHDSRALREPGSR